MDWFPSGIFINKSLLMDKNIYDSAIVELACALIKNYL